jgi:hypothetical protein
VYKRNSVCKTFRNQHCPFIDSGVHASDLENYAQNQVKPRYMDKKKEAHGKTEQNQTVTAQNKG